MLILGTTEVPVFEGMDKIMAAVVSKTLEDAKRQVWREEGDCPRPMARHTQFKTSVPQK